jgi:hypothetical protein
MRALLALVVALAATGCYHDKYDVGGPPREEYHLPPDAPRYNQPDTATYRPKTPEKQQDTLINKGRGGNPNGLGGF